jgi:hypothetical protein
MQILKDHIAVFDNALSDELCDNIIEWFEKLDQSIIKSPEDLVNKSISGVRDGRGTNGRGNRKDVSYFADTERAYFEESLRGSINDCAKEYITEYPNLGEYHLSNRALKIQKTPPHGGYHVWHHEHSYSDMARILVWTAYLNDITEGEGETEFLYQGLKVNPKKGRVCLFPSMYTHLHRGNPPYSCDKYIATGWFLAQPQ